MKTTRQLLNETAGFYTKILMSMMGVDNRDVEDTFTRKDVEDAHSVARRLSREGRKFVEGREE